MLSCSITMRMYTFASCRRWEHTGSAASMNEVALPAERAVCAEKHPLAAAQCRTSDRAADADGSVQKHGRVGETAEPGVSETENLVGPDFQFFIS